MQRIVARRVLAETNYVRLQLRCFTLAREDNNYETLPPVIPPFPYVPPPYKGPTTEQILAERKEFLSPAMVTYYKKPLNLVAGKMQYVFDENGKRYLDAFGAVSVLSCGHCHPGVLEPLVEQLNTIQHTNVLYLNHCVTDYAKALASKMPGNLKVAYFTNSGSEANELAILMARLYTGCNDIISLKKAYHGITPDTMGTNGLSTCKFNVVQTGIHHAMDPDPYRGIFGSDGEKYAENVQSLINFGTSGRVAGFISEAIQGVGGVVELAPGYLPAVYESVRKAGGLCIADEAISGFGRTGRHFWAFEAQGVVPDIVTMAKGIANGSPIGAVVTTPEIAQVVGPSSGHSYGSTFAGNLGSTTAALAVLNVIEKEKLQHNAQKIGSHLKRRLTALMDKHEIIGDVRGRGFFLGVEFVTDRQLKIPATNETSVIMEQMKDLGVLVGSCGYHKNVMRILPPLCSTKADADFLADVLDYILSDLNNSG